MMRYLTAGESHGKQLVVVADGIPAGLAVSVDDINEQLRRRQVGYGRGGRMEIETDTVLITGGVRNGQTTGAPVSLVIENKDHENWSGIMDIKRGVEGMSITTPRPGHADLAGMMKYGLTDIRDVIERASARETAARTAAGALARVLLREIGVDVYGHVIQIGSVRSEDSDIRAAEFSPVRCGDKRAEQDMMAEIDNVRANGDSVGGVVEVRAEGVPVGLGSYVQHDTRLDGRLAGSVMSIPGIKGVEIGGGFSCAGMWGSRVHDEIGPGDPVKRYSNNCGGIEGGVSTGEAVIVRAAMKPIPTLTKPLQSIDLATGEKTLAHKERSDVCAVPACLVVVEAVVCWELARSVCERYGGDTMMGIKKAVKG